MKRYTDKINDENRLEGNIDNALYLDDALTKLDDVNSEVRVPNNVGNKSYNTKIREIVLDRSDIEYCESQRASYGEAVGVEYFNETGEKGSVKLEVGLVIDNMSEGCLEVKVRDKKVEKVGVDAESNLVELA